jgi:hypothetical protein
LLHHCMSKEAYKGVVPAKRLTKEWYQQRR